MVDAQARADGEIYNPPIQKLSTPIDQLPSHYFPEKPTAESFEYHDDPQNTWAFVVIAFATGLMSGFLAASGLAR